LQAFPASDILCVELQKSSLFYAIVGALVIFLKQLPDLIKNSSEALKVSGFGGFATEILTTFVIVLIVGVLITRLYERPRIEFLLEGGTKLGTFTNFNSKIPEIIQAIEKARGNHASESMSTFHNYYKYQARALPKYIDKQQPRHRNVKLLLIIAIIALWAGWVQQQVKKHMGEAKSITAKIQIEDLSAALDMYRLDVGRYPTTEEGLQALVEAPSIAKVWNGPYFLKEKVPTDPWNAPYHYASPGQHGKFDIYTLGADNADGGEGEDRDIASWE